MEFISFGAQEPTVEEESMEEEEEEEEEENESGADYSIEDILKRAAITVKRQLDKLELQSGSISFGTDGKPAAPKAETHTPKGTDMHLKSGLERRSLYLKEIEEDKEELPSAVKLEASKKLQREFRKKPARRPGQSWSFMKAPRMTMKRKMEYQVIMLRSQLDPNRRYKRLPKKIPKVFQIGRVIAGAGEFYSGRLTRKEQKNSLVEEILGDHNVRLRAKRKFLDIAAERSSGRNAARKRKEDRMPKWKKNM